MLENISHAVASARKFTEVCSRNNSAEPYKVFTLYELLHETENSAFPMGSYEFQSILWVEFHEIMKKKQKQKQKTKQILWKV
jgi:hypothetical protein